MSKDKKKAFVRELNSRDIKERKKKEEGAKLGRRAKLKYFLQ